MINGGGSKIFFVMKVSPERVTMFGWNCRKTQGFGCGIATRLLLLPFKFLQMTETTTASRRRGAAGAEPRNGTDRKLNHRVHRGHRGGHFNQEGLVRAAGAAGREIPSGWLYGGDKTKRILSHREKLRSGRWARKTDGRRVGLIYATRRLVRRMPVSLRYVNLCSV
jgi:hypothetical protein